MMTSSNRDFQIFPCSFPVIAVCLQGSTDLKNDADLELGVIFCCTENAFFVGIGVMVLYSVIRNHM